MAGPVRPVAALLVAAAVMGLDPGGTAGVGVPAWAQTDGPSGSPPQSRPADGADVPLRVAILDVDRVFQDAAAVDAMRSHIRASLDAYRDEIQAEEDQIRDAQQELARKRTILTEAAYEEERRKLEQRLLRAQAVVQERKRNLDQTQLQGMGRIQAELNRIVTEIASERSLTLILRKDLTVLSAAALDITDEVLKRLNVRLPDYDAVQFNGESNPPEN